MSFLAKLQVALYADTAEFKKGMKGAQRSLREFKKDSITAAKTAAVGIGAATAALAALGIRSAMVVDETAKLARGLGVSLKGFQALSLVADEAGVDQAAFSNALGKTQIALIKAAQGGKEAQQVFSALGLKYQDLLKQSPEEQFIAVGEAIGKIKNPAERTAAAVEIFGKSGRDLIPMFEELGAAAAEAAAFNERFNVSLTELEANKIEEANDAFGRLGAAVTGLGNTIAVQFAPLVTEISNRLLQAGIDGEDFERAVKGAMNAVATAAEYVGFTVAGIGIALKEVQLAFAQFNRVGFEALESLEQKAGEILDIFGLKTSDKNVFSETAKQANIEVDKLKENLKSAKEESLTLATDVLADVQLKANKRSGEKQQKRIATGGTRIDLSDISTDTKKKDLFKDTLDDLKEENRELDTRLKMFGKQETAVDKAIKMQELQNKFKKEGITLSQAQNGQLDEYLTRIEKQKTAMENLEEINNTVKDTFSDMGKAIFESGNKMEKFKNIAINALSKIADKLLNDFANSVFTGGGGGGSTGGGFLSSLVGSVGSFLGGFFPSFAVGTNFVPNDMMANIHKGEMIIPAREAAALRAGGGGANVTQYITIGAGVTATVRQEVAKMLPEIKRATVSGVEDARLRGATV